MMDATTIEKPRVESTLPPARARIGMIIPSVNSMIEPQFNRFAPPGLGVHVARARVAGAVASGRWRRWRTRSRCRPSSSRTSRLT